jgi:hypothetical protein
VLLIELLLAAIVFGGLALGLLAILLLAAIEFVEFAFVFVIVELLFAAIEFGGLGLALVALLLTAKAFNPTLLAVLELCVFAVGVRERVRDSAGALDGGGIGIGLLLTEVGIGAALEPWIGIEIRIGAIVLMGVLGLGSLALVIDDCALVL